MENTKTTKANITNDMSRLNDYFDYCISEKFDNVPLEITKNNEKVLEESMTTLESLLKSQY